MFRWLTGRGARDAAVSEMAARILPEQWDWVLQAHSFLHHLDPQEREDLRARTAWFLASKAINGAGGFEPDDRVRLSIAAQACLPILKLEPSRYEGWSEIIVYPGGFLIPRTDTDEDGVVHEYMQEAAGEAWDGGPVVLSWEDAAPDAALDDVDFNVVIHEFAHKLDLAGGDADGMPPLHAHAQLSARAWRQVLEESFDAFCTQLDALEASIPAWMDPESDEAGEWYARLPLDPYAATDEAEFFAVSSEAFFVHPGPLAEALPDWYGLLAAFYRQDPLARQGAVPGLPR